jgi:rare lipoprotein A (peptidoglycan hydrolase)
MGARLGAGRMWSAGQRWSLIARAGALVAGCLTLAHCSGSFSSSESRYSKRVVEEGEPVPKGGGSYRVGSPYQMNGRLYSPAENPSYRSEGMASWYGPDFHGRLTANGEVYDMHSISAAHPTMPLPSYARVTNLDNGRSIIVRVNDRGPYARNRVVDVSIGAAKALSFYGHGVARVRVEYVGRAPLEGSDDRMLMATLREGAPAPAPSRVMVASAKPPGAGKAHSPVLPMVSGGASRNALSSKSVAARIGPPSGDAAAGPAAALAGFAAPAGEAPALGFVSGRGLY